MIYSGIMYITIYIQKLFPIMVTIISVMTGWWFQPLLKNMSSSIGMIIPLFLIYGKIKHVPVTTSQHLHHPCLMVD